MMNDKVRVGVVSTSWWADQHHLPCLKSHPGAEVAAVCGRHQGRAEQIAQKYDVPGVFTDYRDMIDKGDLDALVVAVPDDRHYTITMAALDAGLHVACEKPLASTLGQATEMAGEMATGYGLGHLLHSTLNDLDYPDKLAVLVSSL